MFFKKTRASNYNQNGFSYNYNNQNAPFNSNQYPSYEDNRLMIEIKENRRRINNLAKRIV